MTIEWRPIKGYEGHYEVSSTGEVRSVEYKVEVTTPSGGIGQRAYPAKIRCQSYAGPYPVVTLYKAGKRSTHTVHRLVAVAFIPKEKGKTYINHKDGNPQNNDVNNLEWCTQSYNIQYAYDNKTKTPPHMRKVGQFTDDWELVKTWESLAEAGRGTNCKQANIMKVCKGKRNHAGGYRWKYM